MNEKKKIRTNYNICTKIVGHWFAGFLPHLKEIKSLTASDKNPGAPFEDQKRFL